MSKDIEEVKRILDDMKVEYPKRRKLSIEEIDDWWNDAKLKAAQQICQLSESKPELPKGITCPFKFSYEYAKWIAPENFIEDGLDICTRKACGFFTCHNFGKGFDEYHRLIGYEPKQVYTLNCDLCGGVFINPDAFPSPQVCSQCSDENGLLTHDGILSALNRKPFNCIRHISLAPGLYDELREIAKAQRGLTASIKDAECHKRVQAVEETLQKLYQEAQDKWMDDVLQQEAECQSKIEQTIKDDADRCAGYLKLAREECQQRVERIFREVESKWGWAYGMWESEDKIMSIKYSNWQALKKQEGVK